MPSIMATSLRWRTHSARTKKGKEQASNIFLGGWLGAPHLQICRDLVGLLVILKILQMSPFYCVMS